MTKLPDKKQSKMSVAELIRENKHLKEENEKLLSLITDIFKILEKKK